MTAPASDWQVNADSWQALVSKIHDDFYNDLVATIGCGAFDGGCVVVAEAIRSAFGGEVVCLTRADGHADHAAVLLYGQLIDYDGPLSPHAFMTRFTANELPVHPITGYRSYQDSDLPNAPRDPRLTARLSSLMKANANWVCSDAL